MRAYKTGKNIVINMTLYFKNRESAFVFHRNFDLLKTFSASQIKYPKIAFQKLYPGVFLFFAEPADNPSYAPALFPWK